MEKKTDLSQEFGLLSDLSDREFHASRVEDATDRNAEFNRAPRLLTVNLAARMGTRSFSETHRLPAASEETTAGSVTAARSCCRWLRRP